jgi:ABC-2 type transport system permease protein
MTSTESAVDLNRAARFGTPVISVRGLEMRYRRFRAVRGIDLDVDAGEIFAFLGPNGAGKTTTVEILEGFRTRTAGEVSVLGVDPAHAGGAWRDRVGVVLQESAAEPGLSVRECLELYAGYYAAPRDVAETIALVGLTEKAGVLAADLSGGQRRRLDVALALIGDPELIFLDEPTTGFDPSARRAAWDVIGGLRDLGKTVFLTTHYMDEAEHLADRIAVIAAGEIVARGHSRDVGRPGPHDGRHPLHASRRRHHPRPAGRVAAPRQCGPGRIDDPPQREPVGPCPDAGGLGSRSGDRPARPRRRPPHARRRLPLAHRFDRKGPPMTAMAFHQFRYDLRAFWRNPQSRFFTLALPVLFLVILSSVIGSKASAIKVAGGHIDASVYYVPGIITLGIIAASFVNLVISITAQRESGVLKRRRATPVPAAAVILGRAFTAVVTALGIAAVLLGIGWAFYGAHIPARTAPALAVTVVVGALSFCCLGYALASVIHDQDAAQPITQAVMLPLYFISGVFLAIDGLPHVLVDVAAVFPVRHLAAALLTAYNPHTRGAGFAWVDLLILAAWGVGGLLIALRRFSWLPVGR